MKKSLICNYDEFCEQSAVKIYELIDELILSDPTHHPSECDILIHNIGNWAEAHFELKKNNTKLDGLYDSYCRYHLDLDHASLNKMRIAIESETDIEAKEKIILNWFEHSFVTSEERCKECKFNKSSKK